MDTTISKNRFTSFINNLGLVDLLIFMPLIISIMIYKSELYPIVLGILLLIQFVFFIKVYRYAYFDFWILVFGIAILYHLILFAIDFELGFISSGFAYFFLSIYLALYKLGVGSSDLNDPSNLKIIFKSKSYGFLFIIAVELFLLNIVIPIVLMEFARIEMFNIDVFVLFVVLAVLQVMQAFYFVYKYKIWFSWIKEYLIVSACLCIFLIFTPLGWLFILFIYPFLSFHFIKKRVNFFFLTNNTNKLS